MSCKAAKYDSEDGIWICEITDCRCMFLIPSSEACAEEYGEGPDAGEQQAGGAEKCDI